MAKPGRLFQFAIVPVTAFAQNCSIVWDSESKEAVLIDAGGEPEKLKQEVEALGLTVKALWLTHGHLDHAGAVGTLSRIWNIPVIGPHKEDQFWLDMLQEVSQRYGFPIPEKVDVNQWLEGGEILKLGQEQFEVRFAPGHTPGHVVLFDREAKQAWVGDVLFAGSIGRSDFPGGNHDTLVASIRDKLFPLGDDVSFIPGHGPDSTFGEERRSNPFVADRRFG